MRIFFVRHGQTFSNIEHLMDTRPPGAELTPRGREQAAEVGRELAALIGAGVVGQGQALADATVEQAPRVLSSVAIRAQQTAMLAMREFEKEWDLAPHDIPVETTPGLQEIFAGEHEMRGDEDTHRVYTNALRGWVDGNLTAGMPGGETLADVLARFRSIFEELAQGEKDAVVFAHGAAIRAVTTHACGVDADFAFTGYMPNCGMTVLEPQGQPWGKWELRRWAELNLDDA